MNSCLVLCALLCLFTSIPAFAQGTRLLRHPTVSRDQIAFEYAGDLWLVSRNGGQARRITSTQGLEIEPYFSPDGTQIAFKSNRLNAAGTRENQVWVVDADGANLTQLGKGSPGTAEGAPAWGHR